MKEDNLYTKCISSAVDELHNVDVMFNWWKYTMMHSREIDVQQQNFIHICCLPGEKNISQLQSKIEFNTFSLLQTLQLMRIVSKITLVLHFG